ncbi:YhcG family protein [uncultured Deefgea sp.]|uniref:PDDEXK nuclease domain-containing protein n=1 Tax=uncultured Deefgea sp. TaxID=1304914 RepID=UPI00263186C9|nr:PDDEXK nuclease domain-containing protein [uncultured Deefgea sp.]
MTKPTVAPAAPDELMGRVVAILEHARSNVVRTVNSQMVIAYWLIGREIVQAMQGGESRAVYGEGLLDAVSEQLSSRFGRGFSTTNLKNFRLFYLAYPDRLAAISPPSTDELLAAPIGQRLSDQLLATLQRAETAPFSTNLSWSHYVFLMGIKRADERQFYEIESAQNGWSLAELRRQFDSGLFERLALSRNADEVRQLAQQGQVISTPQDLIKTPYVLEFLGLQERSSYSESDLEAAIISKIEDFLLELGKGFLFESRQKRFTFEEEHFFVDLVFYNRLLRCYVLIDLKIGKLTHQNLGQMQMYVNYFDRFVKRDDENATIGMILCKKKNDALVEITLPKDANIHASEYQLYLPSKEELQQRLNQWGTLTNEEEA